MWPHNTQVSEVVSGEEKAGSAYLVGAASEADEGDELVLISYVSVVSLDSIMYAVRCW